MSVPAAGLTTQSRSGWGRRCGLWAANHAHQPASMAEGGSLRSGVAPARRASHARHPGGDGAPPGWPLRAACEELADDRYSRRKRGPSPRQERHQWSAERRASLAACLRRPRELVCGRKGCVTPHKRGSPRRSQGVAQVRLSALRSPHFQGEQRRRRPAPKKIKTSGRRSVG
jgi:hypothetical protein